MSDSSGVEAPGAGGLASFSEPNPLGLSLGFAEGVALVSLRDRALADGLVVRVLDLELVDVALPLDLEGGAERFRRSATRLRTLVLELSIEALARYVQAGLTAIKSSVRMLHLRPDEGVIAVEGELVSREHRASFVGQLAIAAGEPREIRVVFGDALEIGPAPASVLGLPGQIVDAVRHVLGPLGERVTESLRRISLGSIKLDVVEALFFALMPGSGWRIPRHDDVPVHRVEVRPDGWIRAEFGDRSAVVAIGSGDSSRPVLAPGDEETPPEVLRALAREDSGTIAATAATLLDAGETVAAFREMRDRLDASGGPEILLERLLSLGTSEPALHDEASDLARDVLAKKPESVHALLALARIASYEGDRRTAFDLFEKSGRILRESIRRRWAGFAFLAASRCASARSPDRARMLEEAIALLPDDAEALQGLIEELPPLGRAAAAVRAARRLAHLATSNEIRIRAHVAAGDLLRTDLADPTQAKREYERALRVAPDEDRALEGLARAVMDQGDPRRAASIFERLISKAEDDRDLERAARLSLVLGDLWRPLDPEAAMVRYRRAKELWPKGVVALLRLAAVAEQAGRIEVAVEAIDDALLRLGAGSRDLSKEQVLELRLRAGSILSSALVTRDNEAAGQYEEALSLDPNNEEALLALAKLYASRPDRRAVILGRHAELRAAANDIDRAAELWVEEARIVSNDREGPRKVRQCLLGLLARDRKHRGVLDALVEVAELEDDIGAVVEAIDRRLLLDDRPPVRAALLTRLGSALERKGRASEAARAHEEALSVHPNQSSAIEALTRIYRERGDHEKLAHMLERAAAIAPSESAAKLFAERARLLSASGRDEEALESVRRALDDAPPPIAIDLLPLATTLSLRLHRYSEARELCRRRLRDYRHAGEEVVLAIYVDLAQAAEGLNDREELVASLKEAFDMVDPSSDAGRHIASKLARELYSAHRLRELAELQRQRAMVMDTPENERAERYLEAARLWVTLGQDAQGEEDVRNSLAILDHLGADAVRELQQSALDVLEDLIRRRGSASSATVASELADVLGRRASLARAPVEKERFRLEQARVLRDAGLDALAVKALDEASDELPSSIEIAQALGVTAERAGQATIVATAYGRAARLAEQMSRVELAIEMHGRAADACVSLGDVVYAVGHDRATLALSPPGTLSPWVQKSIERLERHAREESDRGLLAEVLGRRAEISAPAVAAKLLLEKASIESIVLSDDRSALDSLRRARSLARGVGEDAGPIEAGLVGVLSRLGLHAEEAMVLVERAERTPDPELRSKLYLEAARVLAGPAGDRSSALSRVQAAIEASPANQDARSLRLELLRGSDRSGDLVDALSEEASLSPDSVEATRLWLEAAEILLPAKTNRPDDSTTRHEAGDIERGLDLVRRASLLSPESPEPIRALVRHTRSLARHADELGALGLLAEKEIDLEERIAVHLRRIDLLMGAVADTASAQAELEIALVFIDEIDDASPARVFEHLPPETVVRLELDGLPLTEAALRVGMSLSESNEDWATYVRMVMELVDLSEEATVRADLRTRAGEILEWKLGDGDGAEREYLAALALCPDHAKSRTALRSLYLSLDRFGDLAENLGVDALREAWRRMRSSEPASRVLAAGEALWPVLPRGSAECADVQLALAHLYTSAKQDLDQAVHVLEEVIKQAPREHQDRALELLAKLFLEKEHYDLYVDVLRRQAERIENDKLRARALADLGEALEWKLGDGPAAEQEYRASLALDPYCATAQKRLAEMLSSQDRFEEMGRDLGVRVLEQELDHLLSLGSRDRDRAWSAADALAGLLEPELRGSMWLSFAERVRGESVERAALERAGLEPGPEQSAGLDRLIALLEGLADFGALVNVLRARVGLETDRNVRRELHYRLGTLLMSAILPEVETAGREALEGEIERELKSVLENDPDHAGARVSLEALYVGQARLVEVGRVLGLETLKTVWARAQSEGNGLLAERTVEALAELSDGEERAQYLVQLLDFAGEASKRPERERWSAEALYQAALEAHPTFAPAREGLRALYESEGRYKDIAQVLGIDALKETLAHLKQINDLAGQLPASLALARALEREAGPVWERADLLLEIALLHLGEEDVEAGELALRDTLLLVPDHALAREELRQLLVAQDRLVDLAEVDEALLAATGTMAAEAKDVDLEIRVLSVLAERQSGERKADTLVLLAGLERRRGDAAREEEALRRAIAEMPHHALARVELENLLWTKDRFSDLIRTLGAEVFLGRVRQVVEVQAARAASKETSLRSLQEKALRALTEAFDELPPRGSAEALELSAKIAIDDDPQDSERRLRALLEARALWDQLSEPTGRERVRLAILDIYRARNEPEALLSALEDASVHARAAELRASLAIERARLLTQFDRSAEARGLVEPLIDAADVAVIDRARAAEILVEGALADDPGALEVEELELRARALGLLSGTAGDLISPEGGRVRWLIGLATVREALGLEGDAVAEPLESALARARSREIELSVRRRLREIYEQLGDWSRAEIHAAIIAEADDRPELWVGLSELRLWLDDRSGARVALERALACDPAFRPAHDALLRLAEQDGDQATLIDRLEAWAEADREGSRIERAGRMLQAARIAAEIGNSERAGVLAERAATLVPHGDEHAEEIALEACAILEPIRRLESMVAVLARVVGASKLSMRASELRLKLADVLRALERTDEARTVIEQGIQRHTPEDDPLVIRLIAGLDSLPAEEAARRLLVIADRLGGGPTARRLRIKGAEHAERAGEHIIAKSAWTTIASEVGVGDEGVRARRSLLGIARTLNDPEALVSALVDAAEDAANPAERASQLGEAAARAHRDLRDGARAESLLRRALAVDPANEALSRSLIELLASEGRHGALDQELETRSSRLEGEELADLLIRRAENARDNLRDLHLAAELFKRAHEIAGSFAIGLCAVECFAAIDEPDEALRLLDALETKDAPLAAAGSPERWIELRLLRARLLEAKRDIDSASSLLAEMSAGMPPLALASALRIDLLERHGRFPELAAVLDGLADGLEIEDAARHRLAAARVLFTKAADRGGAEALLRRAVTTANQGKPTSDVLDDLLDLSNEIGAHDIRVDVLRLRAESMPAERLSVLIQLAVAERAMGDPEIALNTVRRALDAAPGSSDRESEDRAVAEQLLGSMLAERGDLAGAMEAFERCVKLTEMLVLETRSRECRARALAGMVKAGRALGRTNFRPMALMEARALDPSSVSDAEIEAMIEAGGPSRDLGSLLEKRGRAAARAEAQAEIFGEAAHVWMEIGDQRRALENAMRAFELDRSDRSRVGSLREALYQDERWADLERFDRRRLETEDLSPIERVSLLVSCAEILLVHLHRVDEALALLSEARELAPKNREVLAAIIALASELGLEDMEREALTDLADLVESPSARITVLSQTASLLERSGELAAAAECLEGAVEIAFKEEIRARALVDRLAAVYARRGDWASCAQLWVRVAETTSGADAAAALSRAGHIRLEHLGDRRGAISALEVASRKSEGDLGIRRSLIDLALSLRDLQKAKSHARAAQEVALRSGQRHAWLGFTLDTARIAARLGDRSGALAAWSMLLDVQSEHPTLLRHLIMHVREGLNAEVAASLLTQRIEVLPPGPDRARCRRAKASLLEEILKKPLEASKERDLADREAPADVEPVARGNGHGDPNAREALVHAVELHPENVDALARLAKLEVESGAWERAAPAFEWLERLGGPPWPAPRFEIMGAEVAGRVGQTNLRRARLLRARERDPSSVQALEGLVEMEDAGEDVLRDYEAAVSLTGASRERAKISRGRTQAALRRGALLEAVENVERGRIFDPALRQLRELRDRIIEGGAPARYTVRTLLEEASSAAPARAADLLARALDLSDARLDAGMASDVARRLEECASRIEGERGCELWDRLKDSHAQRGDGASLLRIADHVGGVGGLIPLPDKAVASLAAACIEADRYADACTILASLVPGRSLGDRERAHEPGDLAAFRAAVVRAFLGTSGEASASDLPNGSAEPLSGARLVKFRGTVRKVSREARGSPALLELLAALRLLFPDDEEVMSAHAIARGLGAEDDSSGKSAKRLLVEMDPLDPDVADGFAESLRAKGDDVAAQAAFAVASFLSGERSRSTVIPRIVRRPPDEIVERTLSHPDLLSPLGELLRLTAVPIAGGADSVSAFPSRLLPASRDARLSDFAEELSALARAPVAFFLDRMGGDEVRIEPGDPPALVIGEFLAEDATPSELRFHLGRALMLLEIGDLTVRSLEPSTSGLEARIAAMTSDARVLELHSAHADRIRALARELSGSPIDLHRWMCAAVSTATRFGLLVSGDLQGVVHGVRRRDPRHFGARIESSSERRAELRRSPVLVDLFRFILSEPYVTTIRASDVGESPTVRF